MGAWRTLGVISALLLGLQSATAQQTYSLTETVKVGECFRVQVEMKLDGEMRVSREGKAIPLKLSAVASHVYPERILSVAATGVPDRCVRAYESARAVITVESQGSTRTLRADRSLVVAQRHKEQGLVYSLNGTLTREELDLVAEQFDSLAVVGLLPAKSVAVGESWKAPGPVVQALCHFEGLTEQDLAGKLDKVEGKIAHFSIAGSASGIDLGALGKLKIQAVGQFDLDAKRLVRLEWKQQDDRDQGPASPASSVQAVTTMQRTLIDRPRELSDAALVSAPDGFQASEPLLALDYRDAKDRFEVTHGREWRLVSQTNEHVVMRYLDRGDFVAQMTITPWTRAEAGKHLTPEAFKEAMADTPGWEMASELQAGQVTAEGGRWIYRVSAAGQLDGMPVLQNFYLIAAPTGEQVVLVFTMSPKQAERLGTRDLSVAGSLEFPSARKK